MPPQRFDPGPQNSSAPFDVSVVVPAFNRGKLIGATLESVAAQTMQPREVIVVDDGSSDDTARIAESKGAAVIQQANRGIGAARNAGIRAASGEWIAFLDSDDLWVPEKLEIQSLAVQLCPDITMIFSDMEQFNGNGLVRPSFLGYRTNFSEVVGQRPSPDVLCCDPGSLARAFHRGNFINPSTLIVHRSLLTSAGPVDESLGALEDREHVLRLLHHATVAVCRQQLVRYRMHNGQFSADDRRMLDGATHVARRIFENPDRYPAGSVEVYRSLLPRVYYSLGLVHMDRGAFPEAKRLLRKSLSKEVRPRALAALMIAIAGPNAYRVLRRVKRTLRLPGLTESAR